MEEIDMHHAEQVWANKAKEEGILIGEERGIKLGEERGIKLGEERGIKLGEERGKADERKNNIGIFIDGCRSFGIKPEAIATKLVELYKLSYNDAMSLIKSRPDGNVSHPALS